MMSAERLLSLNVNSIDIAQSPQFRSLVEDAIETLQTLLTSEQLSAQERADLALKILELDHQTNLQTSASDQSELNQLKLDQLNLPQAWKEWVIENKQRQVPDTVLVQTMVREGIDATVANQAVKGLGAADFLPLGIELPQRLHQLTALSSCLGEVKGDRTFQGRTFQNYTSQDRTSQDPTFKNGNSHLISQVLQLDNFLTAEENSQLLRYTLEREAVFVPSNTATNAIAYRRSSVLHDFPEFSRLIRERIQVALPHILKQLGIPAFAITQIEAQLTAHGDGNYYKIHNDNGSPEAATRELTYVYYFCREPKPFSGGELRIYDSRIEQGRYTQADSFQTIDPRNNSIVFFLSRYMHEVLPTHCPSKSFADSRFTINGWLRR